MALSKVDLPQPWSAKRSNVHVQTCNRYKMGDLNCAAYSGGHLAEAELDRLPRTPIAALRKRYRELFRAEPPKAFGPDLLRRSIAHRIQEKAYGGLPASTRRLLDKLVKAAIVKPKGRLELPRQIKPGSELVRTWKGKTHRVTVMADGFAYDGEKYTSLSEIATEITGTKWNGPRFFGLRTKTGTDGK